MYREALPQLDGGLYLTDGGLETTLIFHGGHDLPQFAAFDLLKDPSGTAALRRYFERYAQLAVKHDVGLVLESPTWRANPDWAAAIGYSPAELDALNRKAIELMAEMRASYRDSLSRPIVISGCHGPQSDGYDPAEMMSADEATDYHSVQAATFAETEADMITAITMTYTEEAIGVARAASRAGLPCAISFTLETDGRLPTGQPIGEAIAQVDDETDGGPAYFMLNCAHPRHIEGALDDAGAWRNRIVGVRPNASTMSHEELDNATELDDGDPVELGSQVAALRAEFPNLGVLGGCCGTDDRHVDRMFDAARAA